MGTAPTTRQFRTNPIELAIFGIVAVVFLNSAYRLFYEKDSFQVATYTATTQTASTVSRSPASTPAQTFMNVELKCDAPMSQDTTASKIRITGPLCGAATAEDANKLVKALVINNKNKFSATVFTDLSDSKFSTDYIPLDTGKNAIHVEFQYRGGKTVSADITVNKS